MAYTVARTLDVPTWDEPTRKKARDFWSQRHIAFGQDTDTVMSGQRGSLASNMLSYDPAKLIASLTITCLEPSKIDCVLVVNTTMQHMTDWNKAYLELEMTTFGTYLLVGDCQKELWQSFLRAYNFANFRWTLTGGLLGTRMSPSDKARFNLQ